MSPAPRAALCAAMSSSDPKIVGRSTDCASLIGFSSTTSRRIGSLGGQQQPVAEARIGERPAHDLEQPVAGERVLGTPAQALGAGQATGQAGAVLVDRRGQPVHAVDPCDLLDQVRLARDVGAPPVRHRDVEPVGGVA